MECTTAAVLELAPDEASVKAARGLASAGAWLTLGRVENVLWGECRGSGSKPYQVRADVTGSAYKCSCPSRKFPCKHVLALLLLRAGQADALPPGDPPEWVAEWLDARRSREERRERGRAPAAAPSDPAAAAKREKARLKRMAAGLEELSRWMGDAVRRGLGDLFERRGVWQEELAARMVDAQLPGVAARLRALDDFRCEGPDRPVRLLAEFGRLQLLIDAFERRDALTEAERHDVRAALGLTPDKDWVLAHGEHVRDAWLVLGVRCAEEDKLWSRRVWLRGSASGRVALLLDFSYGGKQFEGGYPLGTLLRGELAFYPGSLPRRALAVGPAVEEGTACPVSAPLREALNGLAREIAVRPWEERLPLLVGGAPCRLPDGRWVLLSDGDTVLPLVLNGAQGDDWALLAASGGHVLDVWGEWDGRVLTAFSAWRPGEAGPVWRCS